MREEAITGHWLLRAKRSTDSDEEVIEKLRRFPPNPKEWEKRPPVAKSPSIDRGQTKRSPSFFEYGSARVVILLNSLYRLIFFCWDFFFNLH